MSASARAHTQEKPIWKTLARILENKSPRDIKWWTEAAVVVDGGDGSKNENSTYSAAKKIVLCNK